MRMGHRGRSRHSSSTVYLVTTVSLLCILSVGEGAKQTTIMDGDNPISFPIKFGYVGELGCPSPDCPGLDVIQAGINAAIYDVNADNDLSFYHNLTIIYTDTSNVSNALATTVTAMQNKNTLATLGLSTACDTEFAVFPSYYKFGVADKCAIDMTTYGGGYETSVILMSPKAITSAQAVVAVVQKYGWTTVGYVTATDLPTSYYSDIGTYLTSDLRAYADIRVSSSMLSTMSQAQFESQVASDSVQARIFVIYDYTPNASVFYPYFLSMIEAGLMASGEYAVIAFLAYDENRVWMTEGGTNALFMGRPSSILNSYNVTEDDLYLAFNNVIIVSDAPPASYASPGWAAFKQRISASLGNDSTNYYWDQTARDYDMIQQLVAAGVNILNLGVDITLNTNYWEYMLSRNFTSITGYPDYIDAYGALAGASQVLYFSDNQDNTYSLWPQATYHITAENTAAYVLDEYGGGLKVTWIKGVPLAIPACGFYNELCLSAPDRILVIAVCCGATVLCALVVIALLLFKRYRYERRLHSLDFLIDRKNIILKRHVNILSQRSLRSMKSLKSLASMGGSIVASQALKDSHFIVEDYEEGKGAPLALGAGRVSSMLSSTADDLAEDEKWHEVEDFAVGMFEGQMMGLKRIYKNDVNLTRNIRKEILLLKDVTHENVITFRGMVVHSPDVFVVTELASRGSIRDILENDQLPLEDLFLNQMSRDIVAGLEFLHSSDIGCHGRLKSSNCLIDSRWMVRLSSFGMRQCRMDEMKSYDGVQEGRDDLWSAPEMLRENGWLAVSPPLLVKKADIYSLSILLFEIFGRAGPWGDVAMEPKDILARVRDFDENKGKRAFRPNIDSLREAPQVVKETVAAAWAENPMDRPTIGMIRKKLKVLTLGLKKTIMDSMVAMIEKYTAKLEKDIAERNEELAREKEKSEELLKMMLPSVVAESLKKGSNVNAESFDSVTVYFSDCVGFIEMSAQSKPIDIVNFLNDLYSLFDRVISSYDVYKVETIADAYMCVSGLPIQNGHHHAGEIASMGLALLESVKTFEIRHRPGERVKLRIGMHSGPCVAGVIGLKMPRYCLFGDTVNTASRMESNGIPLRINCSQAAKDILDALGGFMTEERGLVEMKGKGQQMTYFVTGEDLKMRQERIQKEKLKYPTLRNTVGSGEKQLTF